MTNLIPTQPSNIAEEIAYSKDAIVSKIIVNNGKFQITLFAVDENQSFSEHTTVKEAIVHIVEGEGKFMLGDKWFDFKTNDYFYMPQNLLHAIKAKTKFKFLLYQY